MRTPSSRPIFATTTTSLAAALLLSAAAASIAAGPPPQSVLFTIDDENDLLPNGSCGGEGLDSGQFWEFSAEGVPVLTATTAGGTASGGVPSRNISAAATLLATLSPTGIAATGSAQVSAPPSVEADFITCRMNLSLTVSIAQPTTFFISSTGNLNVADFSPISGDINGNQLTAGTYRLSLGVSTFITGQGETSGRTGTFNVVLGPCPADWDQNTTINSGDISAFLTAWLASVTDGDLVADANSDGVVNSGDISYFLTTWISALNGTCG